MQYIHFSKRTYAVLAIITAMVSIQSGAALAKHLFYLVGPQGITSLRLLFASIILCIVWRPWKQWPERGQWRSILFYGISIGVMNLLFYMAIARIPLGIGIALEFTGPLAIALLSSRHIKDFIWVICAAAGIILLLPVTKLSADIDPVGAAYALGAGLCWALYIIFGKQASDAAHGGGTTALGMCVAAIVIFPVGFIQSGTAIFSFALLPMALLVAVFSSAVPYSLEMVGLRNLPTRAFSILMSVEPAIGTVSGIIFLDESLGFIHCIAIGLIIIASIGSTWSASAIETTTEMTP